MTAKFQESRGEVVDLLEQCLVFRALDENAQVKLLTRACRRSFESRETICRMGAPGQSMMVILKGTVRVSLPEPSGKTIILADLQRGDVLGEVALFDGGERSADATALTNCDLLILERRDVLPFLEQNPEACLRLLKLLCARLRRSNERMSDIGFRDLPTRLAKILLERSSPSRDQGHIAGRLADSQSELANMIGSTRENVNRSLRDMRRRGILDLRDGRIIVLQREALQSMIEND
jgi:CRP/FNR family transcriptional regulator, cyclic AMP receptor protein